MTIAGWFLFLCGAVCFVSAGIFGLVECETSAGKALSITAGIVATFILLFGMFWYFENTASGQRALVDQKSDFNNGLERTITVYTADGNIIATYSGTIDIEGNDGGYVIFDYNGKRYTYYNCFVESIADID